MTQPPSEKESDGQLHFTFNGTEFRARDGETLAAALLRAGVRTLTDTSGSATARGAFCWMGWCQECRVRHQGRWVEACRLIVHDGLEAQGRPARDA